ncbi:DUF3732 domain-containing protein [Sphingomonas sanguinis]|uniref:Rad50/SbcC-type AAA domain-containing protein n=1 Tax=Sphingomonas sanguinis TaxID=33051 RepID=A0A147HXB7_9SPHN|nr:DUF3732 domain-containing protein [Sphingomonas sanguinis]KTT69575.1 hypothetical protein NS319_09895 [Sphingomonas sanguinis]
MTFQIANIILYSHDGRIRELPFRIGELNVITGASKTGKSALIDIVDYCTGRGDCYVAEGVIRRHVSWFAVLFHAGDSQIFVARRNPGPGNKTSPDIYVQRGTAIKPPAISALVKNFTLDALGEMLDAAVGINENEHRPPAGQTRDPLTATIRHALTFSFQDQDEIDSKKILFHRTGDNFIAQAVKDSLPYFLGAIDEDRLLKLSLLDAAKRELRRLERQLREISNAGSDELLEARALLEEAKSVGLVDERVAASTPEAVIGALTPLASADFVGSNFVVGSADDALARLRTERAVLRKELEEVKSELRATRLFRTENGSYRREAGEQRARLSAIGLFRDAEADHAHCPLCESTLETPLPAVEEIAGALAGMHQELQAVETESPKIQAKLALLQERETGLEGRLRENGQRMAARIRENELLAKQRDDFVVQARTVGKITQYLSTSVRSADNSALVRQVEEARARVAMLAAEVGDDNAQERLETYLNIIGRMMTDYSDALDLEHRGSQLRLDIRKLTVIADTIDGPVPLQRMGSGENWVGYHVLTHLALHKWFRQKSRPVPGFLILDQPSQAHYPPEKDADDGSIAALADEDKTAVQKLFSLIAEVVREIAPSLQVILLDHADLNEDWFDAAVIERWRHGRKLVPLDWINI